MARKTASRDQETTELLALLEQARNQRDELRETTDAEIDEISRDLRKATEQNEDLLIALEEVLEHVANLEGVDNLHGWFPRASATLRKAQQNALSSY